jgi:hypothetical protein
VGVPTAAELTDFHAVRAAISEVSGEPEISAADGYHSLHVAGDRRQADRSKGLTCEHRLRSAGAFGRE